MSQTTEKVFETYVEEILYKEAGWQQGNESEWDKERALFPKGVVAFLQATQPKLWEEMKALHGAGLESLLVIALAKELDLKGALHVLRHGFKFYGKTFRLAYFKPAHGLNYDVLELYKENALTLTRQVPCHPNDGCTVDMLFAVNGVPVAICELKNPGTGQSCFGPLRRCFFPSARPAVMLASFGGRPGGRLPPSALSTATRARSSA